MARAGPLSGVWRRRVAAMSEVMKGSCSRIPLGLGPQVQILPQQQQAPHPSSASTSCPAILSSHSQPCRRVRQHSSRTIRSIPRHQRRRVLLLDNKLQNGSLCVKHFLSSFHGDAREMEQQGLWPKEMSKDGFNLYPTREPKETIGVQSFSSLFDESQRPPVNYPSLVSQLPTCLEPHFPSASVDQSKTRDLNARVNLDQITSSSTLVVQPGLKGSCKPVPTVRTILEHRRSRRAEQSTADERAPSPNNGRPGPRFEASCMLGKQPLPRTSNPNARKQIEAAVESNNVLHKVIGGIASRLHNTDSLKVELERVDDIKANVTRSITADDVLEIREPEPLSSEEEVQSSAIFDEGVTENSVTQHLRTEELHRKALWMDGRSTPAWMKSGLNLIAQDRLQSLASYGSCRDRSQDTAEGNGSTHMHSAGTTSEAIAVLQNRLQRGIPTDSSTYVKVLQMCLKQKDLLAAKQIQDCLIQSGMDKNLFVANNLLNVFIRCGGLLDGRRVFDKLEKKSVITWNMMITGYANNNDAESALELFRSMLKYGARPTEITYLCILKVCASPLALTWGKQLHECIRYAGFQSDVRVGTALLKMYAKCGCITEARRVFENLTNRDVITWTVMIGGLAQHGCGQEAYRLFLQMRREGFEPDAFTFASILNASAASAGALEWVKEVHGQASKVGLVSDLRVGNALVHMYAESGSINDARLVFDRMAKRDVVTWNIMIGGLAQHGCGHEAYRLFLQMRREGFEPDAFTFASILNASAASAGALEWVKEVHGQASKVGLVSDLSVGNALVHMYAESGSIDDARLVFDRMEKRDVVTWTAMIGGLAYHGCAHEALELFRKMNADRVKPDGTSFVAVLSACCHGGLVDDGRRLFSAMTQDYGIEPTVVHYNCMVDLLGRAGHLEEAQLFISDMPIEPDGVTWTALLGACRTYGNVELGELAAKELFKLEPSMPSTYVLLSNIYAAAGKWENVSLVRTMMQKRGVRKEPGRSWIEVDKKTHEFVVGDTSHPEAKAIYTELNNLTEKLKAEGYIPDTRLVLHDINEEDKELAVCSHSEKLAIAYGLIHIPRDEPIRVRKNLRVCPDCHTATKFISKVTGREIIARDANRFHHFKDGVCSCGDYW